MDVGSVECFVDAFVNIVVVCDSDVFKVVDDSVVTTDEDCVSFILVDSVDILLDIDSLDVMVGEDDLEIDFVEVKAVVSADVTFDNLCVEILSDVVDITVGTLVADVDITVGTCTVVADAVDIVVGTLVTDVVVLACVVDAAVEVGNVLDDVSEIKDVLDIDVTSRFAVSFFISMFVLTMVFSVVFSRVVIGSNVRVFDVCNAVIAFVSELVWSLSIVDTSVIGILVDEAIKSLLTDDVNSKEDDSYSAVEVKEL